MPSVAEPPYRRSTQNVLSRIQFKALPAKEMGSSSAWVLHVAYVYRQRSFKGKASIQVRARGPTADQTSRLRPAFTTNLTLPSQYHSLRTQIYKADLPFAEESIVSIGDWNRDLKVIAKYGRGQTVLFEDETCLQQQDVIVPNHKHCEQPESYRNGVEEIQKPLQSLRMCSLHFKQSVRLIAYESMFFPILRQISL